jgi:predicted kinase
MLRAAIDLELSRSSETIATSLPQAAKESARWQREVLDEHLALFERRAAMGHVRDGHGNLGLEHVFIDDDAGVRIIDRLEFDPRLRQLDICADIASLSAHLAASGRTDLAERFLADYAMEANDFDLYPLVDFYTSLRASLQGKIEWFYADHFAHDPLRADERRARAQRCFKLAVSAPRQACLPPAVVAVGGLVASGKSTVARHLGREIGAPVISSDLTRDFLLGAHLNQDLHELHWEQAYETGFGDRVYDEVMRRAGAVLRSGRPVVVDGCFRFAAQRSRARELAREFGHPFLFVEARVSEDLCRERLRERSLRDGEPDSTWIDIANQLRAQWEPADELSSDERETLDTSISLAENAERLRARLPTWPDGLTN